MIKLPGTRPVLHNNDYIGLDDVVKDVPRPRKRLTELLHKTALNPSASDHKFWESATKEWELRFRLSPLEILTNSSTVSGVRFGVNRLEGTDLMTQRAVLTEEREDISCGLVLRSIGYRSRQIDPEIPFDETQGVIKNEQGRVKGKTGLYCSGWAGRGPVGVILGTMTDGFEVGKLILKDIEDNKLHLQAGRDGALQLLQDRGVTTVSFNDWEKIDNIEKDAGEKIGKPREKIVYTDKLLSIAKS
ncbi:NADPH:adrenodoxin oxidoreductase, mitochondrial-like [Ruditapes philippinarum]|uniref:NADPH:adrenodoxin oxidoreductase, mitochondrial-like n=1 Tax=Ruditapes philippinarum TaxID=129788 RepID=UPI00295BD53A|nr:NADPH:adrenodoxin oxidoreductase, mitochondrial-like [Ruditapes philippinarum]